ncbi:MAG: hypothetical protein JOZ80_10910, partial [Acidobacteriaceae bacterium]|nr:hypothetical protein [Acidobacteriaceae bacterium]
MTKELFVSSTPHETRVGMVEDDQLAEIYLERENEYTLAGSIYKGRVTRVLPGMQSAFVDIGLERDAFLYVSDFMELAEDDEVEDIPAAGVQPYQPQQAAQPIEQGEAPQASPPVSSTEETRSITSTRDNGPQESRDRSATGGNQRESRGNWRSRRRGRGRRGERVPENRFARPESSQPARSDYGPPPGYQPIVLPGESISKYQRSAQSPSAQQSQVSGAEASAPVSAVFPEDEPLFSKDHQPETGEIAAAQTATASEDRLQPLHEEAHESGRERAFDQMGMETVFRDSEPEQDLDRPPVETEQDINRSREATLTAAPELVAGTVEQEEIEEEEADLSSYVEELEEDATFDEMEEETRHAEDYQPEAEHIAPSAETSEQSVVPFSHEPSSSQHSEIAAADEAPEEQADEDAELEEAQEQAEALLDAEARGNGTIDARAEVRAPSGTAAYTQRAQHPGF